MSGAGSTVRGGAGVVCSPDARASLAGLSVLLDGGSAADAALATSAVLAVVAQHMCGLGGDLVAVLDGGDTDRAPRALIAAGRAGSRASSEELRLEGLQAVPAHGDVRAVTVPGCVDGWLALHDAAGRLPLDRVLEPAVGYAERGFRVSPPLAAGLRRVGAVAGADDLLSPDVPAPGDIRRRPGVARALRGIAADGRDSWYSGDFGAGLIELGEGLFTADDLAFDSARWEPALSVTTSYGVVYAPPAPSQGYVTLLAAAVLDRLRDSGADAQHLQVEAFRVAGHDRVDLLGDGLDAAVLLTEAEIRRRVDLVDPGRTGGLPVPPVPGGTVAVTVADSSGAVVSMTQSNASGFGTRLVVPGVGVWLHNRGTGFSLEPGAPNELRPHRRPAHTLAPVVVRPTGGGSWAVATRGGDTQPQVVLQLLEGLRAGSPPGAAVAAPRWLLGSVGHGAFDVWKRSTDGSLVQSVRLEEGAPSSWEPALAAAGHRVERRSAGGAFGHAQVTVRAADGSLAGGSDPRAEGGAAVAC